MQLFTLEAISHVWSKLENACKGGEGITNSRLTEICGFSKDEEDTIRTLVKREFIAQDMIEVVKGPGGGYFMVGIERVRSHANNYEIDSDYLEKVRAKTDQLLKMPGYRGPVSVGMVTGHLGEFDQEKVRAAFVHLPEFEIKKGAGGIKRRKVEDTPKDAEETNPA